MQMRMGGCVCGGTQQVPSSKPDASASETLCQLHFFELFLLENESKLGKEDGCANCTISIHTIHVLQYQFLLLLAKATHIRVSRDGLAILHHLPYLHNNISTCPTLYDRTAPISLLDCDLEAINGGHCASGVCKILIVVAVVAFRVHLATATIPAIEERILAEGVVSILARIWNQNRQCHPAVLAARHRTGHHNFGVLLAVWRPSQALHFFFDWFWQPVLGCKLPALWHNRNGTNIKCPLLTTCKRLFPLLILARDVNVGFEDCVWKHFMR